MSQKVSNTSRNVKRGLAIVGVGFAVCMGGSVFYLIQQDVLSLLRERHLTNIAVMAFFYTAMTMLTAGALLGMWRAERLMRSN